jgi:V8-like Glu-specific endopeptidase
MALSESVNDFFKQQTLKQLKSAQSDTVFYKWLTAMCSKGKPVTRHMMIEKAKSFYDEMSKTEKWTFSEGSTKKLPVRT